MAELSERSEAADRAPDPGRTTTHLLRSIAWWCATVATLVVLDDLTFGPFFWAIARWRGAATAVVAVLAVYVPAQIYLVFRATADHPGRIAAFFLNRLDLERRSHHVARREAQLRGRVVGAASAVLVAPVIGGVLPPIILWRAGYSQHFVRRLSFVTAPLYAAEFAILHGLLPAAI